MPKEKPSPGDVTSTKRAKDKSNSTTLLAMRDAKDSDDSSGRGSWSSSEKDSGFSDNGSEWQQTDSEEQRSLKSLSSGEQTKQGQRDGRNSGNTSAPGPQIQPLYIIKNIVVNQGDLIEQSVGNQTLPVIVAPDSTKLLHGSKNSPVQGSHVILLQQPMLMPASFQNHKPSTRKATPSGRKMSGTYLPILNSYPRIAPHPCKKPSDKATCDAQNLIKRVCTEPKVDLGPKTQQGIQIQPDKVSSSSPPAPGSSSPSLPRKNSGSRHRRFLNTVGILRQSGLLDITVQTKELLNQSLATDRDIAQLRQHTELLCQAACSSGTDPGDQTALKNLQKIMEESGRYPDLNPLQSPPQGCHGNEPSGAKYCDTVPEILDPKLKQQSQVNQGLQSSDVTLMAPDSTN